LGAAVLAAWLSYSGDLDGGELAAFGMALLVLGRVIARRAAVADRLTAVWAGPPERAELAAEEGRPFRRVLKRGLGQAAPACPGELSHAQRLTDRLPAHLAFACPLDVRTYTGARRALQAPALCGCLRPARAAPG
jgi:hypothetical protein